MNVAKAIVSIAAIGAVSIVMTLAAPPAFAAREIIDMPSSGECPVGYKKTASKNFKTPKCEKQPAKRS